MKPMLETQRGIRTNSREHMRQAPHFIEAQYAADEVSFLQPEDWDTVQKRMNDLYVYADFDNGNVVQQQEQRKRRFAQLVESDPSIRQLFEKAVIDSCAQNNPQLLMLLNRMGVETDRNFRTYLENTYDVPFPLEQLDAAVELFRATYESWRVSHMCRSLGENIPSNEMVREMVQRLSALADSAKRLSLYQLEATHATSFFSAAKIDEMQTVTASKSNPEDASQYEGDGVYTGVFGSYRDWNPDHMYVFRLPLEDTLPMIVSYNFPQALANVLSEGLYIQYRHQYQATAEGIIQWRQTEYPDRIPQWKQQIFEYIVQAKAELVVDGDQGDCLIVDTDADPIVWASIARALEIRRCIPREQYQRYRGVDEFQRFATHGVQGDTENFVIDVPDEYYEDLAHGAVSVRGVTGRRIDQYL